MQGGKRRYIIRNPRGGPAPARGIETASPSELDELARALFDKPRRELIAEAAYFRSLDRGQGPGGPEQDWVEAEAEIDAFLLARKPL